MDLDRDQIIDLPDDGTREKETVARYGLAMYHAQVLEHDLANLILLTGVASSEYPSRGPLDASWEKWLAHSLGRLAGSVPIRGLPKLTVDRCIQAVRVRNRLVHDFFKVHTENGFSPARMQLMVDEADEARRLFMEAGELTGEATTAIAANIGMTPDMIEAEFDALRRRAERLDIRTDFDDD